MAERLNEILSELSGRGFRLTRIRRGVVELFITNALPLSALEVISMLGQSITTFNKTTVYRELAFLKEHGVIKEIQFPHERAKRYELATGEHHHHLICLKCRKVEEIELEGDLEEQEKKILRSRGFHVTNHSLEFLGICQRCRWQA